MVYSHMKKGVKTPAVLIVLRLHETYTFQLAALSGSECNTKQKVLLESRPL